ncbi:MAG: A/G-specific adenine glycosylase [Bacteriovoracia bacterium]
MSSPLGRILTPENISKLLKWFKKNKRQLPWRLNPEPYCVWLAEIMSQQTQMTSLVPYYDRFLKTFPTVQDLAQSPLSQVYSAWTGLGYYSRAANVHKTAQIIAKNGVFPNTYEGWLALPGVGPYTAAAVTSQCFGVKEPVWDGNVLRVMARITATKNPWILSFKKTSVKELRNILNSNSKIFSGDINQALMELGALVCRPKNPNCEICPLNSACLAYKKNCANQIPIPKKRKSLEVLKPRAFIWVKKSKKTTHLYLTQRQKGDWFSGMWDFPSELGGGKSPLKLATIDTQDAPKIGTVRHSITHHVIKLDAYICSGSPKNLKGKWIDLDQIFLDEKMPISAITKKIIRKLGISI